MITPSPTPALLLILALLLSACESDGRSQPLGAGSIRRPYDKHCIEGVTYLRTDRSMTVQLDRDSKVVPCGR